ncbi:MAG: tryptophan 2,3-dioxygenase [Actinomycetota bacterium]
MTSQAASNYSGYLKIQELLSLQQPLSDGPEHDELLFIVIHQTYELWFKELIHELAAAQDALVAGDTSRALALLGRIRTILKTCVGQIDILETMTPLEFDAFRERLGEASGFQSAQFREVEAILGRRDARIAAPLLPDDRERVEKWMNSPSLWDSVLVYVNGEGFAIPEAILDRDVSQPYEANETVQDALVALHRSDAAAALVCERLVDIDEGLQEWRYRHVKMVERTIGRKQGTGGSSGADYLRSTLFHPVFPDLWAIRSEF